jgi:hypothetical protein
VPPLTEADRLTDKTVKQTAQDQVRLPLMCWVLWATALHLSQGPRTLIHTLHAILRFDAGPECGYP